MRVASGTVTGGIIFITVSSLPESSRISPFSKQSFLTFCEVPAGISPQSMPHMTPSPRYVSLLSIDGRRFARNSSIILPLRTDSASRLSRSISSIAALPATNAGWKPLKVPLCSPGKRTSYSGFTSVIAQGSPMPPIDFAITTISGLMPARSNEKNPPVLQHPV